MNRRSPLLMAGLLLLSPPARAAEPIPSWDLADLENPGQIALWNPHADDARNGVPVRAVDLNGDGRAEVIVSAFNGDGPQQGPFRDRAGEIHIWNWRGGMFQGQVDFLIPQPDVLEVLGPEPEAYFGCALSHGDFDDDGFADLVVGAFAADAPGRDGAGHVYIFFGGPHVQGGTTWDLADGLPSQSSLILGDEADGRLGVWCASGDVNGDGCDDLVMGADRSDGPLGSRPQAGKVQVLLGPISRNAKIDLLSSNVPVHVIWGVDIEDHFGATTTCADLDGDGFADVVGAAASHGLSRNVFDGGGSGDGPPGLFRQDAGETWIIWGSENLPPAIDLAATDPGTPVSVIYGRHGGARCGEELDVGDVNNDGLPDLLVGSLSGQGPPYDFRRNAGEGYVFFGNSSLRNQTLDLAVSTYPRITIYGRDGSIATDSFVAGDINGDGYSDLLVGMPRDPGATGRHAGTLAVVYSSEDMPTEIDLEHPESPVTILEGADYDDDTAYWSAAGDVDGDGFDEVIVNAMSGDGYRNSRLTAGDARVVSGAWLTQHPAPPANPVAVSLERGAVVVSWTPPVTENVTGYVLRHGSDATASEDVVRISSPGQTLFSLGVLTPYVPCYIKVASVADNKRSRFTPAVRVVPGVSTVQEVSATREALNRVRLTWEAPQDMEVRGYWIYRRTDSNPPTPQDLLLSGDLVPGTSLVDTTPPPYQTLYYWVSAVTPDLFQTDLAGPVSCFTRPDEVGEGLLVVNDYDWIFTSDGPGTTRQGDPYEFYGSRALTADLPFTFWDIHPWSNHPPGIAPVGTGPLDGHTLFEHGMVMWVGHGPEGNGRDALWAAEPMLLEYHAAGGVIFLASWIMEAYLPPGLQELFRIEDWEAPTVITASQPMAPTTGELGMVGPDPQTSGAPFSDLPLLDPTPYLDIHYTTSTTDASPLFYSIRDIYSRRRLLLLSASPSYLDPVAFKEFITPLTTASISPVTGVDPVVPARGLEIWPNPGRDRIHLRFRAPRPGSVQVAIFDFQGRLVRGFQGAADGREIWEGVWDGRDDRGRKSPAGLYFVRVEAGGMKTEQRLLRLP